MSKMILPDFQVGTIVITTTPNSPYLTEDQKYVILDVEGDWIQIEDDSGEVRYYQSHLFIEVNIYYNMLLWLMLIRLFDIDPKYL